jgi:hypothetical protein
VPFAGIAFLWFMGIVREQIGEASCRCCPDRTSTPTSLGLRTSAIPRWVCYLGYLFAAVLLLVAGEDRWTQVLFPPGSLWSAS